MAITTRSMNQHEETPTRGEEVAPPVTNPFPNAPAPNSQQMLETMQQLVVQNQQMLQLMLTEQGGAQLGRAQVREGQGTLHPAAPHPAAPHLGDPVRLGDPLGVSQGAPHRGTPYEEFPPPPPVSHGGNPHLQEDEGENQSMEHGSHSHVHSKGAPNHWDEKIKEEQNQLGDVFDAMKAQGPETVDYLVRRTDTPFKPDVANYPLPQKFKMPSVETFDGKKDPFDHLETYKTLMQLHRVPDEIMCRAFPTTLKGSARQWFAKLAPASISSFIELSRSFVSHFIGGRRHQKPVTHLLSIKQDKDESLRSYLTRFNEEILQVEEPDDKVSMTAFLGGLRSSSFLFSVMKRPPRSMPELLAKAQKNMNAEDITRARRGETSRTGEKRKERDRDDRKETSNKHNRTERVPVRDRLGPAPQRDRQAFTPLNASVGHILCQIQEDPAVKWPGRMKSPPNRRNPSKYCRFHRDHGHDTDDCYDLKRQIEDLIQRGHLRQYVAGREQAPPPPHNQGDPQPIGEIHTISGGLAGGGESLSAMKAHARKVRRFDVLCPSKALKQDDIEIISFSDKDLEGIQHPHDDPLVLTMTVANFQVRRILVDSGSSADILFVEAYDKLSLGRERLQHIRSPLIGFSGEKVYPLGSITLPVTAGAVPQSSTVMVNFLIIDCPSAYNIILGRPALNTLRAVPSTYHLILCFPTPNGVGEIRGDQLAARECYVSSMKTRKPQEALQVEILDPRDDSTIERGEPAEKLIPIVLDEDHPDRRVYVGSSLSTELVGPLIDFLKHNMDVFAWSHADLEGIDPEVATHRLNVDPHHKPVRQKLRGASTERAQAMDKEVRNLIDSGAVREVAYPEWLSNVVMVTKTNGKWRLCVDFTKLNKACPKDSYPLPRIDLLIDATAGHELLTFLDAYSGYNQISMHPPDQEKTSFITPKGTYCYRVMPFGLKNAGVTYQRLVNKMFQFQIGRTMEVYVDDMLVKSLAAAYHVDHLQETFNVLRSYHMKLNPEKCAFGVGSGKFLGFMVNQRGIEANPDKIKAILDMKSPSSTKELQRLNGRIAALNRFVSKSADKCLPFFKILRKAFEWELEAEEAFQRLKAYLATPPLLSHATPGEVLHLYLSASSSAVSSVLVRNDNGVQRPIYYVSRAYRGAEIRYSELEKLALALVTTARRLQHYFQSHCIVVTTDQPLKTVLGRPDVSGRLLKWAVELGEFDIQYQPRTAIKAQALADFIAELTPKEEGSCKDTQAIPSIAQGSTPGAQAAPSGAQVVPSRVQAALLEAHSPTLASKPSSPLLWKLYVDGSSTSGGGGAGLILISPDGITIKYAAKLHFAVSNNEAEYEALLSGLRLAVEMEAQHLSTYSDSQLIVNQVKGEFEAKGGRMQEYFGMARTIITKLHYFEISHIHREDNIAADALARLASSIEAPSGEPAFIGHQFEPSKLDMEAVNVNCTSAESNWMTPIRAYLQEGVLPDDALEARKLRVRASKFTILQDTLYKKGYSLPLLRCLSPEEAHYTLREIHEGICGNHSGGRTLAHKALRQGYFWPTMVRDAQEFSKKCDKCQRFAPVPRQPPEELTTISSPWPFSKWGIDILGPLPLGKGQCKFVVVAIDYFTKWAEAEPLASITDVKVKDFIWKSLVCRFEIPHTLVSDNAKQFDNKLLNSFCSDLQIKQPHSSPAHPQANGQA